MERKFYDLGRVNDWGPQSKKVDFGFDSTRTLEQGQAVGFEDENPKRRRKRTGEKEMVRAR